MKTSDGRIVPPLDADDQAELIADLRYVVWAARRALPAGTVRIHLRDIMEKYAADDTDPYAADDTDPRLR